MLDPNSGRARLYEDGTALHITIPSKAQIFGTVFVGFWMIGWAFGFVAVLGMLLSGGAGTASIFLLGWLGAWTAGGAVAATFLLWNIAGQETITITPRVLILTRSIPVWDRSTECAMSSVSDLRAAPAPAVPAFSKNMKGIWAAKSEGAVQMTYGVHTLGFGLDLDHAEAVKMVDLIHNRFPHLAK